MPADVYNREQVNLLYATGEPPDVYVGGDTQALAAQGVIRTIPEEWLFQYAPDIMSDVERINPSGDALSRAQWEGDYYSIPVVNVVVKSSYLMTTRKDWIDSVGTDIDIEELATFNDPEYGGEFGVWGQRDYFQLSELRDMLFSFRHDDPDGNGKKDTYGLGVWTTRPRPDIDKFPYVFGIRPRAYFDVDGTLEWTHTLSGYREALHELADWYADGIIDPEVVVDRRDEFRAKYATGYTGAYEAPHRWIHIVGDSPAGLLLKNDGDAFPVHLRPPEGPNGHRQSIGRNTSFGNRAVFGINCSDECLIKLLGMFNAMYSDAELYNLVENGIEGTHFDFVNGKPVRRPEYRNPESIMQEGIQGVYHLNNFLNEMASDGRLSPERTIPFNMGLDVPVRYEDFDVSPVTEFVELYPAVETVEAEFFWSAVTGRIDIDAEWESYLQRRARAGGTELDDAVNAAWRGSK